MDILAYLESLAARLDEKAAADSAIEARREAQDVAQRAREWEEMKANLARAKVRFGFGATPQPIGNINTAPVVNPDPAIIYRAMRDGVRG